MYEIKFWTGRPDGLSTDDLNRLYAESAADGTLDLVAYDCPRLTGTLFETFVRRLDRIGFFGGVYDRAKRPVGFLFLSAFEGDTARLHFCLLRRAFHLRRQIGAFALEMCFSYFKLKTLIGLVPVINQGAVNFCREMGGRETATIAGACWIARLRRSVGGVQFLFTPRSPGQCGPAAPVFKKEESQWAVSVN